MRKLTLLLTGSVLLLGLIPAQAQPVLRIGPGGVLVEDGRGDTCGQLRYACEHKYELGQEGEGNCRRYRETCQRPPPRQDVCAELRAACIHKEELGEVGAGNCRRYRETCGRY